MSGVLASIAKHAEDLLSLPSASEIEAVEKGEDINLKKPQRAKRKEYENRSARFRDTKRTFENQYNSIYVARLKMLRSEVEKTVKELWLSKDKNLKLATTILQAAESQTDCVVVGTVFKNMPLVSRILQEYSKERGVSDAGRPSSYVSDKDTLILEDEAARIPIVCEGSLLVSKFVSGMVVAFRGKANKDGDFLASDVCFADIPPQPNNKSESSNYVAIVAGLEIGDSNPNPLATQLFFDYLSGALGSPKEQTNLISTISHLIIAGNSLCKVERHVSEDTTFTAFKKKVSQHTRDQVSAPLKELDSLIPMVAQNLTIDLMPGSNDPSNFALPQQPFNRVLFPKSSLFGSFKCVTNPHECLLEGRSILGCAGQNLDNLDRYTQISDRLALLEQTLRWRHIVPTAPDQMAAYPFSGTDPFVIQNCPHIYFSSNQNEFATKLVKGSNGQQCRLIIIPSFAKTKTFVLVNLNSLEVHPITIETEIEVDEDVEMKESK